jgi:hypothetical protein
VDEADRVLARLARIERLDQGNAVTSDAVTRGATTALLLDELRALVREAEDWARSEGDARARLAVSKLREEAAGMD